MVFHFGLLLLLFFVLVRFYLTSVKQYGLQKTMLFVLGQAVSPPISKLWTY